MNDVKRIMAVASDIKHSREVVRYGVSLAKKYDAELVVLHVEHDPFGRAAGTFRSCRWRRSTRTAQGSQEEPDEVVRTEATVVCR